MNRRNFIKGIGTGIFVAATAVALPVLASETPEPVVPEPSVLDSVLKQKGYERIDLYDQYTNPHSRVYVRNKCGREDQIFVTHAKGCSKQFPDFEWSATHMINSKLFTQHESYAEVNLLESLLKFTL